MVAPKERSKPVSTAELPPLHTAAEVASRLHRSVKWLKDYIKANGVEYTKVGSGYYFSAEQLATFEAGFVVTPALQPVTTGSAKS